MLTWETATAIYRSLESITVQDSDLIELKRDLFDNAVRYAQMRADWALANSDARMQMDDARKAAHNALIDSCNILSRSMASKQLDVSWRKDLGTDRKDIGDFACYLHAMLGIAAR